MTVALIYLLGVVVVGALVLAHFATDGTGEVDMFDAMGAAFIGFFWPITGPFLLLAAALLTVWRLTFGRNA